ncbi:hypothetical protein CSUB01_08558 [Colletotrichum sublineola]|uniref:Uncharacterized protein n=1 Tax=Colletotrichum sublineola TaxID=1173701 RepID=A0A066XCI5_COLSU|nr:hypothetical protein CSUB01_08558 [Colletotrichum sublineola]
MSYWFNSVASPAAYKKRIQALPPSLDSLSKSTSHWGTEQLKAARVLVVARNLRDFPVTPMPSGADQLIQEVRCLLDKPDATSHAAKQLRRLLKGPDLDDVSKSLTAHQWRWKYGSQGGSTESSAAFLTGVTRAIAEVYEKWPRIQGASETWLRLLYKTASMRFQPHCPLSRLPTSSTNSEWMSTGSSKDLNLAPETLTVRFFSAFIQEALLWLPGQDSKDANPVVTFDDASAENRVSLNGNIKFVSQDDGGLSIHWRKKLAGRVTLVEAKRSMANGPIEGQPSLPDARLSQIIGEALAAGLAEKAWYGRKDSIFIIAAARQYMMFLQVDISDDYKTELINRARRHDAKFNEFIKVSATQWFDLADPHHRRRTIEQLTLIVSLSREAVSGNLFCATGGNRIGAFRLSSDVEHRIDRVAKAFPFGDGIASRVFVDAPGRLSKLSRQPTLIELEARLHAAHQGTSRSELAIRRDTLRQRGGIMPPAETAAAVAPAGAPATFEVLPLTDATNKDTKSEGEKPGQARAPRERRERGPPADRIASKTMVMVANLPYDLTEVPWRLFTRHQSPDPIPASTGALTNHLNARHAAATSNYAIPDMPLTPVLLVKRRHLVTFPGEEAQATAALSEGLSDRTEVAMQWQPSGHLIIGARSARFASNNEAPAGHDVAYRPDALGITHYIRREGIRAPGPDSQLALNDFVSIIRGSSIDTVTNVCVAPKPRSSSQVGMASISGDGHSGVVAAAVVGTESDGVACALRQFLSKSRHGFYLEKPFLEFKCQPPTFAAIAFANNLVTDIIVNIVSLMHLHYIAYMRLLPPAPAATATSNAAAAAAAVP